MVNRVSTNASSKKAPFFIRPLRESDLPEVWRIEKLSHRLPWSNKIHQDCVESKYPSILLENSKEVIGFAVFNYLVDECHLLNIAVDPQFQGQGFATKLLNGLLARSIDAGALKVILEARASNQAAIKFYIKEGFEQIGCRKKYYKTEQGHEDAIVMQKLLTQAGEHNL